MKAESRELYVYTVDHFENELSRISKDSACTSMAVRQVVKKAIVKYCNEYTDLKITQTTEQKIFSDEDFKDVSNQITDEILNK